MSWQPVEQRITTSTRRTASMRLILRGEATRPACIVSLRKDFAGTTGWKAGDMVGVQVGEGEHAGLIRLVRLKKGAAGQIASVRRFDKGGMTFDLGHLPPLGTEAHDKQPTDARQIDADTIEVAVPNWGAAAGEDEEEEDDPPQLRPQSAAPARPAAARVNGSTILTKYGVTLDLQHDAESIAFGKKTMDLTTRQAAVVATLLRAYPQFVNRPFILKNALADVPQHTQDASLDLIVTDLTKALAGIEGERAVAGTDRVS